MTSVGNKVTGREVEFILALSYISFCTLKNKNKTKQKSTPPPVATSLGMVATSLKMLSTD